MKNKHQKNNRNFFFRLFAIGLATQFSLMSPMSQLSAQAKTIKDVEKEIKKTEQELKEINENIDEMTQEQELLEEQMDDLNAEIINMFTSIGMLQDDISEKEQQIAQTQIEYDKAKKKEEDQKQAMTLRIQMNYEKGQSSSFTVLLESNSFGDFLNRLAYVNEVQRYDQKMLTQYNETKTQTQDLWNQLEEEKAELQEQKRSLEEQKAYCEELKAELQVQSENYDSLIAQAEKQAKAAKAELQKEKKELNKLKEEERKKKEEERRKKAQEEAAKKGQSAGEDYTKIITDATGSELGKEIAKYACKFVGNPYVAGGTSLTNGADCSGFTYRVYKDYGYTIPRTSYEQRSAGTAVEYKDAQPGDLICYSGHVAMYIGDGKIVHASSKKTGIKYGVATYKKILAVRRIIQN